MRSPPLRVLGAGPAGLTAALTLARAGRAVEVYERQSAVGARFDGDLQAIENWSSATDALQELGQFGIVPDFLCHPFTTLVQTNLRRSVEMSFARPAAYVVKRGGADVPGSLDVALLHQATSAGAVARFDCELPPDEAHIIATGPGGGGGSAVFAVARGMVFETTAADMMVGLLHDAAAMKGYAYLVVVGGAGCLCSVVFEEFSTVHQCFERARLELLERYAVPIVNPRPVGGIGHFSNQPDFRRGTAACVGEAAGLQDFLWGFGIRTAIRSGHLAARCLLEGRDYARAAAAMFDRPRKASVVNRFLFEAFRGGDYRLILAALRRNPLGRLRSFYGYNLAQRLLYAPARLAMRRRFPKLGF